jgi:UDP-N-acetylglucosamine:LPS N-acetylglucosamine transferase
MSPQKNFLILTSDSGFGHRSAANAVAKAMKLLHPQDSETVIVNPMVENPTVPLLKMSEQNYDRLVTNSPDLYRFVYEISDSRPASGVVENTLTLALYRAVKQLVKEVHPNAILSTNQTFNGPTGAVIQMMQDRLPFYTVVTDLADVHSMWFNDHPDRFFVASEAVQKKAISCGIDLQKIYISGIPVNPDFASPHATKPELRLKLGLDPQLPTVLIVGSRRVSGIFEHLEALEMQSFPFQVVVIAGGNNDLYEQTSQRKWSFSIQIQNYVTNMPEWMLCADLLVTKAGGLILSEGLAAGLPMVLIDYLPGQEEGNVRYILNHQAGAVVEGPLELTDLVNALFMENKESLKFMASNARRCGHPDAALVIAESLWQADENQVPQEMPRKASWSRREHITRR